MSDHTFELVRDAKIEVIPALDGNNHPVAEIIIDDRFSHDFKSTSRVSKALDLMTPDALSERLSGGSYFIIDDELYDFRDGRYTGFMHSDDSIHHLVDTIGIEERNSRSIRIHENTTSNGFNLGRKWSDHGIIVPDYSTGGEFTSELHFGWNPFVKTISSAFMLYRLICENGMRGLRNFMNTKIPLFNRWEEHLEIANRQIQTKVSDMITDRLRQMGRERASVAEASRLAKHAFKRLTDKTNILSGDERTRLSNIIDIATPSVHLDNVYKDSVFADANLAAQHPAHLTVFDLFNMVTELRSHTQESEHSSDLGLDKLANDLVFDRKDLTMHASQFSLPRLSSFSDPDAAFFGHMH